MEPSFLKINYQTRYFTLGKMTPKIRKVWIVLHGYGQLAPYFIKKFKILESEETFILAPEGLNRFYLESFSGKVGATWMTKEDRLTDISNYIEYLDSLYRKEIEKKISEDIQITLLGYSQGCATACRWIVQTDFVIHRLILWSGIIPPDLNLNLGRKKLKNKEIQVIYGNEDPFLKEKNPPEDIIRAFKELQIDPLIKIFKGGHEIPEKVLQQFS
ncbi:esterase [soil metagenome]